MQRTNRFRPSVERLEGRRLMAADGFEIHGFINTDDPTSDGTTNTMMVGEIYRGSMDWASCELAIWRENYGTTT